MAKSIPREKLEHDLPELQEITPEVRNRIWETYLPKVNIYENEDVNTEIERLNAIGDEITRLQEDKLGQKRYLTKDEDDLDDQLTKLSTLIGTLNLAERPLLTPLDKRDILVAFYYKAEQTEANLELLEKLSPKPEVVNDKPSPEIKPTATISPEVQMLKEKTMQLLKEEQKRLSSAYDLSNKNLNSKDKIAKLRYDKIGAVITKLENTNELNSVSEIKNELKQLQSEQKSTGKVFGWRRGRTIRSKKIDEALKAVEDKLPKEPKAKRSFLNWKRK